MARDVKSTFEFREFRLACVAVGQPAGASRMSGAMPGTMPGTMEEKEEKMREHKVKELEVQGLISALLLGIVGGGLYAGPTIPEGPLRDLSSVSFCISVFSFLSATIMSGAYMVVVQSSELPLPRIAQRIGPRLWDAPKAYFLLGYCSMLGGILGVFLSLIQGHSTFGCLAF